MLKVSIITVCYNSQSTIRNTILSVLEQTYDTIEYIIIDGASEDSTVAIINSYENEFNGRMKWISEKDNGIYDAMNKGIYLASGDLIGILNSDDVFFNNMVVEKIVREFDINNYEGVYGDLIYIEKIKMNEKVKRQWKAGEFERGSFVKGWHPPHPTLFLRKDVYKKYGIFNTDYKIAADIDFMFRIFEKGLIKTKYIPEIIIKMQIGGRSNKNLISIIRNNIECYRSLRANGISISPFIIILKPLKKIKQIFNKSLFI